MVNRRIIDHLETVEGSATLPSVLKINKERHFNTISGSVINNGHVTDVNALDGSIGNNYNEFSIEFLSDNTASMCDGVKRLYLSVTNDMFITIKKDLELERYFKIYKIDDLSYQAMTMNNYDFFIKVFKTNNGANLKVSSNALVVLKSYTTKEAWILLDKSISNNTTDTFKLIIDFTYRFFKDETYKKLRFPNVNTYSNTQDLFNFTQYSSPYFDSYTLTGDKTNMTFLNPQSEYITRIIHEIFSLDYSRDFTLKNFPKPVVTIMRNYDGEDWDIEKFKQKTLFNSASDLAKVDDYICSLSYEVYGYKPDDQYGTRCFLTKEYNDGTKNLAYARYEIYPILPGVIHYVFKKKSGDTHQLSIDNIRKSLKTKNIYLYNYVEMSINTFNENNTTYIDIYSHVPYTYEAYDHGVTTDVIISDTSIDNAADSEVTDILDYAITGNSNDYRSRFDISKTYENDYVMAKSLINTNTQISANSYFMPYFGNDIFVKSIITNYLGSSSHSINKIPQIFSDTIDLLELKEATVLNKYFDILGNDSNFATIRESNTINASNHIAEFEELGIRNGYAAAISNTSKPTISGAFGAIEQMEDDTRILCENLEELLPNNVVRDYCSTSTNQQILNTEDCLFVYINTSNSAKYINLTFTYKLENNKVVDLYQSYPSYLSSGGEFIIPVDTAFLKQITFHTAGYRYYVMK